MNGFQKKAAAAMLIFCAVLFLGACSPDPETTVPTEQIVIKNIPLQVERTKIGEDTLEDTFKVYVQLSAGMSSASGYSAKGDAKADDFVQSDSTITATIHNLKDKDGNNWKGKNWANLCVVISPETVIDIFDIDVKVGMKGPGSSSTVVVDWELLWQKSLMDMAPGADGISDYKLLYNDIVVEDPEIGGSKKVPPGDLAWIDFK